jgi:cytochrome c-type biogenesis protein CcmE
MRQKAFKVGLTTLVLAVAFGGLLYSSLREGTEYYKHVDEVMTDPEAWYGKRLQLHGFVADGSLMRKPDSLDYRFQITHNGKLVSATYSGIAPDTFKDGAEVVVKGRLSPEGFAVEPNGVMAKCPSKYQPKSGGPVRSAASTRASE